MKNSLFIFCVIVGIVSCSKNKGQSEELGKSFDNEVYVVCISHILEDQNIVRTENFKMFSVLNELKSNYGVSIKPANFDEEFLDLIADDSTWLDFFALIQTENILEGKSESDINEKNFDFSKIKIPNYENEVIVKSDFETRVKVDSRKYWKGYYEKYPNSFGVIRLTDVLYSKEKNKAMVIVEYYRGDLDAAGMIYFIQKDNGWHIKLLKKGWVA